MQLPIWVYKGYILTFPDLHNLKGDSLEVDGSHSTCSESPISVSDGLDCNCSVSLISGSHGPSSSSKCKSPAFDSEGPDSSSLESLTSGSDGTDCSSESSRLGSTTPEDCGLGHVCGCACKHLKHS